MERTAIERQPLSGVPLPLALAVASFAAPLGVLSWLWLSLSHDVSPLSLSDAVSMLAIGYMIGTPFALGVSLLVAWPAMAWMRRRHAVAWTSTLGLSVTIGTAVYVVPTLLYLKRWISIERLYPIATMGAMAGLFAGVLLCGILRPPFRVRRHNSHARPAKAQ